MASKTTGESPASSAGDDVDLDPADWSAFRRDAHQILDDMIDYIAGIRDRPVWSPMPAGHAGHFDQALPLVGEGLPAAHAEFMETILPYTVGNVHPRFMGWVHGGGNAVGMIGEMVAAGLNANLGGRNQAPVEVERQVVRWFADLFGFPDSASGLLVTGSSIANFMAVLIARVHALGIDVRRDGLGGRRLLAYTSAAAHSCIPRAMDMAGLGTDALRPVPCDNGGRMDGEALAAQVAADRGNGHHPFLVVGTAGTVDTGAIDDLPRIAALCRAEGLWFHVDGAIGALGMLSPVLRPLLDGLGEADSIAFDFHKWGQIPYDAGCLVVRDGERQRRTFANESAYLRRAARGLAGGSLWPCDLGPDLSRGFRALKVWYTLKSLGADRLGAAIERTCVIARHMSARIDREPELERVAATTLNIVCFRFRFATDSDRQTIELAADVQESGIAAPSTCKIDGSTVLRCAIVNHRTRVTDVDAVIDAVLTCGRRRAASMKT